MATVSSLFIIASLFLLLYRIVKGPHWSDRIICADLLAIYLIAGLLVLQFEYRWHWDRDAVWLILALGLITIFGSSFLVFNDKETSKTSRGVKK